MYLSVARLEVTYEQRQHVELSHRPQDLLHLLHRLVYLRKTLLLQRTCPEDAGGRRRLDGRRSGNNLQKTESSSITWKMRLKISLVSIALSIARMSFRRFLIRILHAKSNQCLDLDLASVGESRSTYRKLFDVRITTLSLPNRPVHQRFCKV